MAGGLTITVTAVNIGKAEPIATKTGQSGIFKHPQAGAVAVGRMGLTGDVIVDLDNHGGVDQAVYVFTQPDYDAWAEELGRDLPAGTFGENLVISGLESAALSAGDRLSFGTVVLEVTSPRIPCATLTARMGDPDFANRFFDVGRTGFYTRVLAKGTIVAGAVGKYVPFSGPSVTMAEMVHDYRHRPQDPDFSARALDAPVHYKLRARLLAQAATR
jgi:MOSC domain-containing protein YiiM